MKYVLALSTLLAAAATFLIGADSPAVTYIAKDKVAEALAKGTVMVTQPDLTTQGGHRVAAGQVEVHEKETDIFYVTDGEATIVTGGTMVGGKMSKPGQWLGASIDGGETRHLGKGDVMVIPAGVPHWFKEVPKEINYLVVKVIK
jgi:mannose-6-phosphate isomerase-like protein (cupin superfamily)